MFEHELAERYCPCGAPNPRQKARYCRSCGAAASRRSYGKQRGIIALRRRNREVSEQEKAARNARAYLAVYIKRGIAEAQPCETCGRSDGRRIPYQPDPAHPLEARWFCSAHYRDMRVREAADQAAAAYAAEQVKLRGWRLADPSEFASKREWFRSQWPLLDESTQKALREVALRKTGAAVGIAPSEESPLFQSALVSVFDRYSRGEIVTPQNGGGT